MRLLTTTPRSRATSLKENRVAVRLLALQNCKAYLQQR